MDYQLKPADAAVLNDAQRSNGGGIRIYPASKKVIDRLIKAGLLVPKKGNRTSVELFVITREGRQALEEAQKSAEETAFNSRVTPLPVTTLITTTRNGTETREQWIERMALTTRMSREQAGWAWEGFVTALKVQAQKPLTVSELEILLDGKGVQKDFLQRHLGTPWRDDK